MWDRALFNVRRRAVGLGPRLGSWRLSIVLMVLAALYYGFLAIWARSSPPHVVANIASMIPFWIVYGLLLLNTTVCLWYRIPALRQELARRRFAALGTFLFHGAFLLLAAGFLLSMLTRQEAKGWAAVGEEFVSSPEQILSRAAPAPLAAGVPDLAFRVERIFPEFWRDQFLFTTLEADLLLPDGKQATTRINRPLWLGLGTFLRLSGFGYAPRYELVDREGRVLDSAFIKLNVFPPGQRDYFRLPDYPHRFYLQVYPDLVVEDGVPASGTLNLVEPGTMLHVFRGRLELGSALLRQGEGFEFEGLTLRIPEIRYWGEFSIVSDSGTPVLFLGYAIGMVGLLLKLGGRRWS